VKKILFVTKSCCVRVIKEAFALINLGYELHLVSGVDPETNRQLFETIMLFDNSDSLARAISFHKDIKLIHVHNEPSWMVSIAKGVRSDAKVIFDVHDSDYWRFGNDGQIWFEEDFASEACDAYVFPSKTAMNAYPRIKNKPAIWLPSANSSTEFRWGPWGYQGGIVSQGGHIMPDAFKVVPRRYHSKDFTELYQGLAKEKTVYALCLEFERNEELRRYYENLGVITGWADYEHLIEVMGSNDWVLNGNTNGAPIWDVALPNKFFDALSAGVPIANAHCPEVAKPINRYDVGINFENSKELLARWDEHREKRINVFKNRGELAMERFIPKLEKLYNSL